MKLIDYLKAKGVVIPGKVKCKDNDDVILVRQCLCWNSCHDRWANLEVPESKELDKKIVKDIWVKQVVFNPERVNVDQIIEEICSLQPEVKVPSEEEIEKIVEQYSESVEVSKAGAPFNGISVLKIKSKDVARAIREYLIKNGGENEHT